MDFGNQRGLTVEAMRKLAPSVFASQPHESRSTRYGYIPTVNVIAEMMKEGFVPVSASQSTARDISKANFTKHMIRFRHQADMERKAVVGDSIREVVMVNAHDGTSAFEFFGGLYRYVCGNGMVVADRTIGSIKVPHRNGVAKHAIEKSYEILMQTERIISKSREWAALPLNKDEQLAFATAAHRLRFEPVMRTVDGAVVEVPHAIQPADLLQPRRWDDKGDSLWHTFNRVQESVIRGGLVGRHVGEIGSRRPGRQITTREVKGIDQNIRLNQALWENAELMAALKS